ncbi:uncharacterized protein F5147DRAFT_724314 [Suillus discolor]|uniref:Homeobox domain-containing protein n=1 Tax=Suillus discolor TaxID=1912936 RepID=A0A9P7EV25_9AGAM|nr:uncharacterized protein F5147DRAFT_724314 [Suillus discolor]KAG2090900.1 hypothetical protein F5147DRAFT_724314 [Suillus discolor]
MHMARAGYVGQDELPRHPLHCENPHTSSDCSPSPISSSAQSPVNVGTVRPSSASLSDSNEADSGKVPSSGPERSKSISGVGAKWEREKRKRSRVTPEQLIHLERFFSMDRSPTAARRKEISDLLGMQERQTQIWFQNRRAKAKLQDGKKGRGDGAETPPDTPPELATGYEAELHSLIHEDEPVTIIPCNDLSIGTWRRIATAVGKHDLVAYLCDGKRCLTWFIHSAGYGFKMEIPFDIIVHTEFTNAAPGSGLASFILSQPPTFYLESFSSPGPTRQWKKCADWTEGQQATKILRHDLIGSAVQLAHILRHLNAHASGSDIRLHSPSYYSQEPPPPLMEVPQPPMAILTGPAYPYGGDVSDSRRAEGPVHIRRRSFSGGTMQLSHLHRPSHQPLAVDLPVNPTPGPHSAPYASSSFSPYSSRNHPSIHLSSHSPMFSEYANSASSHSASQQSQSPVDYGPTDTHSVPPRSYSSAPVHHMYDGTMSMTSPYSSNGPTPSSSSQTPFVSPSPPLLTTPFYPPTNDYSTRG